jgi:conjugative relaxase-like TrwC/TraI family protein
MLSIGKLATGQASYYLAQAQRRVDRATSVSSGVDDYYLSGPEADGEWLGAVAGTLGQHGSVEAQALQRVLAARAPATDRLLPRRPLSVPGFDVTFSAPKSVSVLFGVGDPAVQRAARDAHDDAVRAAFGYLERHAAVSRKGRNGVQAIAGEGLIAAAFRHRTSRAGDPQLHTHVLIANLTLCEDARWRALDGRRLFEHARTAGFLYEARLRAELTRRLGVAWTRPRNGIADVVGVPQPVLRAFSRRRVEIEHEMRRLGQHSAAAAQVATLETRRSKDARISPEALQPEWRARAASLGLNPTHIREHVLGRVARHQPLARDEAREVAGWIAGVDGITRTRSAVSRADVVRAWCEAVPAGADISVERFEALADHLLASPAFVPLLDPSPRDAALRRRDGRLVPAARDDRRWSTPELLAAERRILDQATTAGVAPTADVEQLQRALAARPTLSREQAAMVRRLVLDDARVSLVVGKAGTGKTFALDAARAAWEASGMTVLGAAVARRAAQELETGSGILSTSVAALLLDLRESAAPVLSQPSILVIDEASLLGTRDLAELVDRVCDAGAKLVLVGDDHQLPSIEAGGAFRALRVRGNAIALRQNRRQRAAWERRALDELRRGDVPRAYARYARHGRVTVAEDAAAVREKLVNDWYGAGDLEASLMIAFRRSDVADLNERAREALRRDGRLGPGRVIVRGADFSLGDHVVLRRNSRRHNVSNGDRGVVVGLDAERGELDVRLRNRVVRLDHGYLDHVAERPAIQHGYAVTGHIAQGMTVEKAFVLGTDSVFREWGYVSMSRGRRWNGFYAVAAAFREREEYAPVEPGRNALDEVLRALGRSRAELLAHDVPSSYDIARQPVWGLEREAHALAIGPAARLRRLAFEMARLTARRGELLARALPARRPRRGSKPQRGVEAQLARAQLSALDSTRRTIVEELSTADLSPLVRAAALSDELERRRRLAAAARVLEPPPAMLDRIGPRPERPAALRRWTDTLATHALEHSAAREQEAARSREVERSD